MSSEVKLLTAYTGEARKIKEADDKALLIWVANGKPYFKKHYWFRGLAPAWNRIQELKDGTIQWEEFEQIYRDRLETDGTALYQIEMLVSILTNEHAWYDKVYLVCYEKDDTHCHRRILKEVLDARLETALQIDG